MPANVHDLTTPCLLVDKDGFEHNVATMGAALAGNRLRPHVKAFKSTSLARELAAAGHRTFCCATVREMEGMAAAGLGDDLLLANEVVGSGAERLGRLARSEAPPARVTVAIDSAATLEAAAAARIPEVLIDVYVGLPRCGCDPAEAGPLAERAQAAGLSVRGVMGYEGHLMREPMPAKAEKVAASMEQLVTAHADVGGDVVSAGGTGTYELNRWATEIQAGSYVLMDTEYVPHAPAFRNALYLWTTVISVHRDGWAVCDGGLKSLGMDHGNPTVEGGDVLFVSDEHITYLYPRGDPPTVGDRVRVIPSHVDPTVAYHERMHVVDGEAVIDCWEVDLRGW